MTKNLVSCVNTTNNEDQVIENLKQLLQEDPFSLTDWVLFIFSEFWENIPIKSLQWNFH